MIRPATRADARAIAELEVRAWRWALTDIVDEPDLPTVAEREQHWHEPTIEGAWVWDQDGQVVAVVHTGPDADESDSGRLHGPCVEPAAQGAGLGTALHDHALATLRAAGFGAAVVWVLAAHGQARAFYTARGWRLDCRDAGGETELRYTREL